MTTPLKNVSDEKMRDGNTVTIARVNGQVSVSGGDHGTAHWVSSGEWPVIETSTPRQAARTSALWETKGVESKVFIEMVNNDQV